MTTLLSKSTSSTKLQTGVEEEDWKTIIKTKDLQPNQVDTVIYHHPCSDGTASGYIAWKYFSVYFPDKHIDYFPMQVGSLPPPNLEGKNVLICDFSFRKDVLASLLRNVNKLLIIDHHKSAEKDLKEIDDKFKLFDMGHSGAMLTWFYFFPDSEPPLMIKYVQDRDIWTKALPFSDDFTAWFYTLPLEFSEYDKYRDDKLLSDMIQLKGIPYKELNDYYIKESVNHSVPKFCKIGNKYYFVAYVNSTVCKSDVGHMLFEKYPFIDFAAVYSINDSSDTTSFSLRSTEVHADVSEIAFSLGGGGHAEASGVRIPFVTNKLPGEVYNCPKFYNNLKLVYFGETCLGGNNYKIVYLPSYVYKKELASYLLQTKYKTKVCPANDTKKQEKNDTNGETAITVKEISVSESILMSQCCYHGVGCKCGWKIQISAIWSYDPCTNTTTFLLGLNEELKKQRGFIDTFYQLNADNEIELQGFYQTLPNKI